MQEYTVPYIIIVTWWSLNNNNIAEKNLYFKTGKFIEPDFRGWDQKMVLNDRIRTGNLAPCLFSFVSADNVPEEGL